MLTTNNDHQQVNKRTNFHELSFILNLQILAVKINMATKHNHGDKIVKKSEDINDLSREIHDHFFSWLE